MLGHALDYAGRGWPPFPCRSGTKIPATLNGFHDATTDEAKLRDWWGACPDLNVGIRTGAESGLVVIDLDHRGQVDGLSSWCAPMTELGVPYHHTRTHGSPSEGLHLLYAHPGTEVRSSASKLGPCIDVRGDRGCIMMPPSVVADPESGELVGRYEVDTDAPVAPLPEPLIELVKPPPEPNAIERALMAPDPSRDLANYVKVAVDNGVQRILDSPQGQHNDTINAVSYGFGRLVGAGRLDYEEARQAATVAGEATGHVPRRVARAVRSGLTDGMRNPRL
jgi:Bifunctional DNA primase/polymerase, N-terminal